MNSPSTHTIHTDVTIIGGGIAGLWLLNRLRNEGYRALLFEHKALGSDQTVASQGMIHGGIKYTLGGALSGASEAIAGMPAYWRSCLRGEGDIDLRGGNILSDHFYLWSSSSAAAKVTTFLASKAIRGRVDKVTKAERPIPLQNQQFKGTVYKLVDMVLDVPGILQLLAGRVMESIYQIDWQHAHLTSGNQTEPPTLQVDIGSETVQIKSNALVLTAGQGNETLLQQSGANAPAMQRRPLQQVMVKHRYPHSFYGHCLGAETTPRLTISSHPCEDGSQVWYLGGSIAAKGVDLAPDVLIDHAKKELSTLLPWIDLKEAEWATLAIDRAEPQQHNFARPDQAYASWASGCTNVIAAWPAKLTLAPNLSNQIIRMLEERNIRPYGQSPQPLALPKPAIASAPWQLAFGN
ncbi:MAG: glycerol-3-phosphate dehydrogenase [Gammaproteobacteria bacterium]|nr:MAG: glycerol-3-phosphate dehydrogenase [Gammaproteobacteria bacterium]RLA53290.1 MAG: glycerol-3-phosphate dehydrogenase [Gammaproteobacteria bacterium]